MILPRPVLALIAAPDAAGQDLAELLRVLVALVASDVPVRLAEIGPGRGVLGGDALGDDAERMLEAVAGFGVRPETLEGPALAAALREAGSVLRLGAPQRAGTPGLLEIGDRAPALQDLLDAGQVVRAI